MQEVSVDGFGVNGVGCFNSSVDSLLPDLVELSSGMYSHAQIDRLQFLFYDLLSPSEVEHLFILPWVEYHHYCLVDIEHHVCLSAEFLQACCSPTEQGYVIRKEEQEYDYGKKLWQINKCAFSISSLCNCCMYIANAVENGGTPV